MNLSKTLRALVLVVCGLMVLPITAMAQSSNALYYHWSLPMGDTKDFVDNDSWVGFSIQGHKFRKEGFSLGYLTGWTEFYYKSPGAETIEAGQGDVGGAITADNYRDVYLMPFMLTANKWWGRNGEKRAHLGLGAGVYYIHQVLDVGSYSITADEWIFGLAPELGFQIPMRSGSGDFIDLNARYHYPVSAGDWIGGDSKSWQGLSFGIGYGRSFF